MYSILILKSIDFTAIDKHIWSNNQNYYLDFILQNSDDISNCDGNDESKVVQEQ